jgi:tetratricopeptide (TPR) repeat protein
MSHPDEPSPAAETRPTPSDNAIQTTPPMPPPPAPEPRVEPPISAEALRRARFQLDALLAGLLVVLAVALASFAIQNSDFWMHLATGRALVQGTYDVFAGNDPFSYTTEGVRWVNHSWLYDCAVYGLFVLLGGPGLVVLKGILTVLLTFVLFQMRRPGQSFWAPVVCVVLALLALSPRLLFQPTILSFLFLAITLLLLLRTVNNDAQGAASGRAGGARERGLWLLPPLFALWGNLDGWFILGPLTVALFLLGDWLGRFINGRGESELKSRKELALVLVVGLAACMVNPGGVRVFALPAELAYLVVQITGPVSSDYLASGTALHELTRIDPSMGFVSPLMGEYWQSSYGLNVAGISYFLLLGLGILSFVLAIPVGAQDTGEAGMGPRLLVWLVFALLSLLIDRLIPFFAVVAGPIAALNLQDFGLRAFGTQPRTEGTRRVWSLGGRLATVAALLGLLFLAWPGWLNRQPDDPGQTHRVAWHIYEDPSLRQAARRLEELQQTGKLAHGFNLSPDLVNYLSWFSPGVKGFLDRRLALFADCAAQYAQTRKALLEEGEYFFKARQDPKTAPPRRDWQPVFKTRDINFVIISGLSKDSFWDLTLDYWIDRGSWVPLYLDGRTSIYGWIGAGPPGQFAGLEWDLNRLAFGAVAEDLRAPQHAPNLGNEPRGFWRRYWLPPPAEPLAAATSKRYSELYHNVAQRWFYPYLDAWRVASWPGPIGVGATLAGPASGAAAVASFVMLPEMVLNRPSRIPGQIVSRPVDAGPPGAAILAVRCARRALGESPDDAVASLALAAGYDTLWKSLEQHWVYWQPLAGPRDFRRINFLDRQTMRMMQVLAALTHFAELEADQPSFRLVQIERELSKLYLDLHYLDVSLEHLSRAREALADMPVQPEQTGAVTRIREELDQNYKALSTEVKKRRDYFDLKVSEGKQTILGRFEIALLAPYHTTDEKNAARDDPRGLGLARLALDLLQQTNVSKLTDQQKAFLARTQLTLLLTMGRVRDAREGLVPDLENVLGPEYDVLRLTLSGATGDYQQADEALANLEKQAAAFEKQEEEQRHQQLERWRSFLLATMAFPSPMPFLPIARAGQTVLQQEFIRVPPPPPLPDRKAPLLALRGLLALEQGDTRAAAAHFRKALSTQGPQGQFPDRPIVEQYLRLLNDQK